MGPVLATRPVIVVHQDLRNVLGAILIIIHPLHILRALVQLLLCLLLEIIHRILRVLVLKFNLVSVANCVWKRVRNVLEGTERNRVVVVLVTDVDERIVLRRGVLQHLLEMALLFLMIVIENGLVASRKVLLLVLGSLIHNVLKVVCSESLMELFVAILLRLELLIVSVRAYHLVHVLVKLWRFSTLVCYHVTQLRR